MATFFFCLCSVSVLSLFCLCSVSVPTGGRGGGHSDGQVKELVGVAVGTRGVPLRFFCLNAGANYKNTFGWCCFFFCLCLVIFACFLLVLVLCLFLVNNND